MQHAKGSAENIDYKNITGVEEKINDSIVGNYTIEFKSDFL